MNTEFSKFTIKRRKSIVVKIGNVLIGGNNKIAVQSMCSTKTNELQKTIEQIKKLEKANCEIVRVAVPDIETAKILGKIKSKIKIPLVADIHFDYRIALIAIDNGIDKLRINPGNIGNEERIKEVIKKARERKIPIRIGVNSGSIEKDLLEKYGNNYKAMAFSALKHIQILEKYDFTDTVISLKGSNIIETINAYKYLDFLLQKKRHLPYPFHIGITEAGTLFSGSIKSAAGISLLLANGYGDTIRVSLTDDVVKEVETAYLILNNLGLRNDYPEIISCPTCGRCEINLKALAYKVENYVKSLNIKKHIKIAVMGCIVNAIGEGKEADIGIGGGKKQGIIFLKGKIIEKVPENKLFSAFKKHLKNLIKNEKTIN
ncbi:MAG TPA: flavodoxin-dependent (E)-4-hydroxy-3-methylbut-2-enyl-diphosphate synthase [bacterium]|nr:flavodoxin-dependent (E)-4-hydroxy-3-methylbut-2-enyl-diphosphate synthase [bacterium]HOL46613.1 flavodoxin-dependent (E)-4-hydroxy-3-methylbut-2-enyl-diphosphate synthase [bacterium]HPQ17816.1 flavodoxin-dependent (E)-4-hydroxy-3-methylbut-2-enyl-diphosphate synthase [bacterium]